MATVFDVFREEEFDYLTIERGTVRGNIISSEQTLRGVVKLREGMIQGTQELAQSSATIHAHPEDFSSVDEPVGNAVRFNGLTYRISGVTGGKNFDNGQMEHYTLTLAREEELDSLEVPDATN